MKTFINLLTIISFSMAGCFTTGQIPQSDNYSYSDNYNNTDISYQTFYNELQPYGNWIDYPDYGRVWLPGMQQGFRPYETGGHWVSTVDGWAWASDYNWGWAPFHYGRWFYDQSIGWAWVPGYEWAPAWVTWGQYNDYYAWAPLAPGISIGFGNTWRAPSNYWAFVPRGYINYSNLNRYATYGSYGTNVNNITIINNYNSYNQRDYYHRGPNYQEVSRFTRNRITPVSIASADQPGSSRVVNKQFRVYRPDIRPNAVNNNNNAVGETTSPTRQYNGAINRDGQNETNTSVTPDRNVRNPNLNNLPARGRIDAITNGADNNGKVTQRDIDNTNREFQQRQVENLGRFRNQTRPGNTQSPDQVPATQPQAPQSNRQVQDDFFKRQQEIRNNNQQRNLQQDRMMQRPTAPEQPERMIQRPQAPAMPQRVERSESSPAPAARPGGIQRPPR